MSPYMYRVTNARTDEVQSEVPPFEAFRTSGQDDESPAAEFVCAITLDQLRRAGDAVRMVATDPNLTNQINIQIVSDAPALPIIDGVPQYQGPPDENPDWRVAAAFSLGTSSATFFGALDYLDGLEAAEV